jgi:hypothetical protein
VVGDGEVKYIVTVWTLQGGPSGLLKGSTARGKTKAYIDRNMERWKQLPGFLEVQIEEDPRYAHEADIDGTGRGAVAEASPRDADVDRGGGNATWLSIV